MMNFAAAQLLDGPCLAVMFSPALKICNLYEEQNGCPTGMEKSPAGYQQLLNLCPVSTCQLTEKGARCLSPSGWL